VAVQRVKYRKEVPEEDRLQAAEAITQEQRAIKDPKWGKIGAPDSQKRRDYLDSIRKKKRKARSKMVKEKVEDDIELVEEAAIELEEDKQVVEKPEPPPIKEKIKPPGPVIEPDYINYPY